MQNPKTKRSLIKTMSIVLTLFCFNTYAEIVPSLQIDYGLKNVTSTTSDGERLDSETTNSILLGVGINWNNILAAVRYGNDYATGEEGVVYSCDRDRCDRNTKHYGELEIALEGEYGSIGYIRQLGEETSAQGVRVNFTPFKLVNDQLRFGVSIRYLKEDDSKFNVENDVIQLSVSATITK